MTPRSYNLEFSHCLTDEETRGSGYFKELQRLPQSELKIHWCFFFSSVRQQSSNQKAKGFHSRYQTFVTKLSTNIKKLHVDVKLKPPQHLPHSSSETSLTHWPQVTALRSLPQNRRARSGLNTSSPPVRAGCSSSKAQSAGAEGHAI